VGAAWRPAGALEAPGDALRGTGAQVLLGFLSVRSRVDATWSAVVPCAVVAPAPGVL